MSVQAAEKKDSASKDKLISDKEEISREILALNKEIITSSDATNLLAYISNRAKANNVEIVEISPSAPSGYKKIQLGDFYYLPIIINAKANFHDLSRFIDTIEREKYLLEVNELLISQNFPSHRVNMMVKVLFKKGG